MDRRRLLIASMPTRTVIATGSNWYLYSDGELNFVSGDVTIISSEWDSSYNAMVTRINVDEGVTYWGRFTFNLPNCTELWLPSTLSTIESYGSFTYPITDIFYNGTPTEFALIQCMSRIVGTSVHRLHFYGEYIRDIVITDVTNRWGGNGMFEYSDITSLTFSNNITNLNGKISFSNCTSLTDVTLPNSVTSISSMFSYTGVNELIIPNSVVDCRLKINYMNNLKKIVLGTGINTIIDNFNDETLSKRRDVKVICLGNIVSIGNRAFTTSDVYLLDFRYCTQVPTVYSSVSMAYTNRLSAIVVPDALYNDWVAADIWSSHASKIVKASEYVE